MMILNILFSPWVELRFGRISRRDDHAAARCGHLLHSSHIFCDAGHTYMIIISLTCKAEPTTLKPI